MEKTTVFPCICTNRLSCKVYESYIIIMNNLHLILLILTNSSFSLIEHEQ